jgi:hypothetical protein
MLPACLLAFMASLIIPLIAASSIPVCISSAEGYQLDTLNTLYQTFCGDLSKDGLSASRGVYGVPVISLSFVPTTGADECDQANCLSTFGTLIQSCQPKYCRRTVECGANQTLIGSMNNHSVWGTGSLDAGCGTYNFTIWNTTSNPVGTATNTIAATATPVLLNLASTQTSASTSTGKPTPTKPSVGSTALGTSDSAIIQVSGVSLLGVAFLFCFL